MWKRVLIIVLSFALIVPAPPVFGQGMGIIRASENAIKAVVAADAQARRPAARGENPYMTPGLVLLGLGGALVVWGFAAPSGVKCSGDFLSVECGTTANKGLLFAGLASAGAGATLIMVGEGKRGRPTISLRLAGMALRDQTRR